MIIRLWCLLVNSSDKQRTGLTKKKMSKYCVSCMTDAKDHRTELCNAVIAILMIEL